MNTTTLPLKHSMNRAPFQLVLLISLALACFALSPMARAICREGCDANLSNTFLGEDALLHNFGTSNTAVGSNALRNNNTTGQSNTAIGSDALRNNSGGSVNTAIGALALVNNTEGGGNTAVGVVALASNTTGNGNIAIGGSALTANRTGFGNTATGGFALSDNNGDFNTATGHDSLTRNLTGRDNTATGAFALEQNLTGSDNTATGKDALNSSTGGFRNTATGRSALSANTSGNENTAMGFNALLNNTTGSKNVALGFLAGSDLTAGDHNIDIGNPGQPGESSTIRIGRVEDHTATFIAGINGATVPTGVAVIVNANGRLGTITSSARFKEAIKPMDKTSEAILALKPVTFRYKHELDPAGIPQFGLVAEEVEKVNPDLVARDADGKAYTVRYEAVNAMLLNEFLKERRKVESLERAMEEQQKENAAMRAMLKEQAAQIQKVSAKLELNKASPQTVLNNR